MSQMKAFGSQLKGLLQKDCFRSQNLLLARTFAQTTKETKSNNNNRSTVTVSSSRGDGQVSTHVKVGERIKQTGKDVTNLAVILAGLGIAGGVGWLMFKEFFSSKSPTSIYSSALEKCKQDDRVIDELGNSIKGHGERTKRGRARQVSHVEFQDQQGRTHVRVKFYLKGDNGKTATVQCETTKDSPRKSFRYLFVQMDQFPHRVIIIEDNRLLDEY